MERKQLYFVILKSLQFGQDMNCPGGCIILYYPSTQDGSVEKSVLIFGKICPIFNKKIFEKVNL